MLGAEVIPFNHLGLVFDKLGSFIYPHSVRNALCSFLKKLESNAKVLDVGAGTGILCKFGHLCREDLSYIALDPAEGMLKYAKAYATTYQGVAEELPFKKDSFDAVMMGESLHHFSEIDKALGQIVEVLKENGKIFIYDFDLSTFRGKSIAKVEKFLGEPANFFSSKDIKDRLESFGFEVELQQHGWRYTLVGSLNKFI